MASYKSKIEMTTVGAAISTAYGELESLAGEMGDWRDNIADKFSGTDKYSRVEEAASTLENFSERDVPDCVSDLQCSYSETVPTSKRKSPSRAVRCGNAASLLTAAAEAIREFADAHREKVQENEEATTEWENGDQEGELELPHELTDDVDVDELDSLADDLENDASDAEGIDFPGMFG